MNILLIDDHHLVLEGLQALLEQVNGVKNVYKASGGKEAFELVKSKEITIALTDLQMPEISGFEVIEKLKEIDAGIKILVLSMDERAHSIQKALDLGADGYVLKNEKRDILEKALQTVMAGGQFLSSAIMRALLNKTAANSPLSAREKEIAITISHGQSNQVVADSLFLSAQTVATHRKNIYRKLNITNTAALVKYVAEQGWI